MTPVPAVAVTVPPQALLTLGVLDTTSVPLPAPLLTGSVSLKATPVRSPLAGVPGLFGLLMVKVNVVVPFSAMLPAPNALVIEGGATTVTAALAVLLAPPSVELTCTLLFLSPAVVPCTSTETAHDALAATVPPDKLAAPEPPVAVAVPPQVLFKFGVEATTKPAGRVSVKLSPVSATLLFGLVMLIVNNVVPFSGILVGANVLVTVGAAAAVSVAVLLVAPVPPLVELTCPVVFGNEPDWVAVTFTVSVQEAPAATVPPERAMVVVLAVAVTEPLQVFETPGVLATCRPFCKVSEKPTPDSATFVLGLLMVKVTVVVPPTGTLAAPKALLIVGAAVNSNAPMSTAELTRRGKPEPR